MLIIVAMATAVIAPSFYTMFRSSPQDEAGHLAKALRMAEDEVTLSGRPMVWYASRHAYGFEQTDGKGKWMRLDEPPFGQHWLPKGLAVLSVQPADAMARIHDGLKRPNHEPVLARLLLMPAQGVQAPADIVLGAEGGGGDSVHIRLHPGHGGIHVDGKPE